MSRISKKERERRRKISEALTRYWKRRRDRRFWEKERKRRQKISRSLRRYHREKRKKELERRIKISQSLLQYYEEVKKRERLDMIIEDIMRRYDIPEHLVGETP